ncbi:hypothetical protein M0Q97_04815 [Candidatus Dojkabacteria bacterium]|nr:hypothetical protein [Candidatus Dojkabacteria bacterium]
MDFCDLIICLDVKFNKLNSGIRYEDKDIIYYSNININDLVLGKEKTIIPIIIYDVNLNIDKLISIISHEIRHIYDVYTINDESDMKSFINTLYYTELLKNETDKYFVDFLQLVYLSLEHELIARNTMIWEMFRNCKCEKNELYKLYYESYMYKSFNLLNSFNYHNLIDVNNIEKVNNFINYFGGSLCENENDIIIFFKKWQKYFKEKSDEYLKEGYKVLNDILNINEFKNSDIKIINVKDLLLYIHNNYIFNE